MSGTHEDTSHRRPVRRDFLFFATGAAGAVLRSLQMTRMKRTSFGRGLFVSISTRAVINVVAIQSAVKKYRIVLT